jgi:hypothetical protein
MTIFVDHPLWTRRGKNWCHLFSDGDEAELHEFADRMGLKRSWFQQPPRAKWKHYDITAAQRYKAVRMGAVEDDRWKTLECASSKRHAELQRKQHERMQAAAAVTATPTPDPSPQGGGEPQSVPTLHDRVVPLVPCGVPVSSGDGLELFDEAGA